MESNGHPLRHLPLYLSFPLVFVTRHFSRYDISSGFCEAVDGLMVWIGPQVSVAVDHHESSQMGVISVQYHELR